MRRQTHTVSEAAPDINTVKTPVELWKSHIDFYSECSSFTNVENPSKPKRTAPGRENAACPAGQGCWGQSLRLICVPWMNLPLLLCRPSVEIPFQASHREDFRKKTSKNCESFWAFFLSRRQRGLKTRNICLKTWHPPCKLRLKEKEKNIGFPH